MEKREKLREHIQIPEGNLDMKDFPDIIKECVELKLDDVLVPYEWITEFGRIITVDNDMLWRSQSMDYLYNQQMIYRAYVRKTRWRISAIRRSTEDSSVTFIEVSAPVDTAEHLTEFADYLIEMFGGERVVVS